MKIRKVFRSAITGLFVTKKEAEASPKTTVQETVKTFVPETLLDEYAREMGFEDFDDLMQETAKFKLKEHFILILKSLA